MKNKGNKSKVSENLAQYYDRRGILGEITAGPLEFSLEDELRGQILRGERSTRLRNISIKLEPAQIQALQSISVKKSIPYQTLIRSILAAAIEKELPI